MRSENLAIISASIPCISVEMHGIDAFMIDTRPGRRPNYLLNRRRRSERRAF